MFIKDICKRRKNISATYFVAALVLALMCSSPSNAMAIWLSTQTTDPITDQTVTTATTEYAAGAWNRSIVVRCTGKELETFVDFGEYLNDDTASVQYRFDKDAVEKGLWTPGGGGTAVFAYESRDVARRMVTGSTFVLEATDFQGQPHRALFDITGAGPSVSRVLSQCGVTAHGLEDSVPGLRKEVALELERWGPKHILIGKQILTALGTYSGSMDSVVEPQFAIAVQKLYDDFVAGCRAHGGLGTTCRELRVYWDRGETHYAGAVSVIYDKSPGRFKKAYGDLHSAD
jgi:hypothetical protein